MSIKFVPVSFLCDTILLTSKNAFNIQHFDISSLSISQIQQLIKKNSQKNSIMYLGDNVDQLNNLNKQLQNYSSSIEQNKKVQKLNSIACVSASQKNKPEQLIHLKQNQFCIQNQASINQIRLQNQYVLQFPKLQKLEFLVQKATLKSKKKLEQFHLIYQKQNLKNQIQLIQTNIRKNQTKKNVIMASKSNQKKMKNYFKQLERLNQMLQLTQSKLEQIKTNNQQIQ